MYQAKGVSMKRVLVFCLLFIAIQSFGQEQPERAYYDKLPPSSIYDLETTQSDMQELKAQFLMEKSRIEGRNQLPIAVFDRDSFDRNKWDDWYARSSGLDGLGGYKEIDKELYKTKVLFYAKDSNWDAVSLYVEGYIRAAGERPNFILYPSAVNPPIDYNSLVNRLYGILRAAPGDKPHHLNGKYEWKDMDDCRRAATLNRQQLIAYLPHNDYHRCLGAFGYNGHANHDQWMIRGTCAMTVWAKGGIELCIHNIDAAAAYEEYNKQRDRYAKYKEIEDNKYNQYGNEQNEEFPEQLARYEKSLETVELPGSNVGTYREEL